MNVILFVLDTLRADHLGCYGYFRDTSPTIDDLAAHGVVFDDFRASAVATGPGFSSIISGRSAISHGFYLTPYNVPNVINFDDAILTLPELIWDHGGYTTAACDNLINFCSHMKQFVRGFEYYVNVTRTSRWLHHHVVGGDVNERLIPWLQQHSDEQFFLFVHYWDPHLPYNQPDEYRTAFQFGGDIDAELQTQQADAGYRYVPGWGRVQDIWLPDQPKPDHMPDTPEYPIDLYDGEILYTDHLIEQVMSCLEETGIAQDTVVIVTADHGEQLGQHDIYGHAGLHEANVFVPLIVWQPQLLPQGKRTRGYAQHADIAPTVLDIIGAPPHDAMTGHSVLDYINETATPPDEIFIETAGQRGIQRDTLKLIRRIDGELALYDIAADPMETQNIVSERPELAKQLQDALNEWIAGQLHQGRQDPMQICLKLSRDAGAAEGNPHILPPL